MKYIKERVSVLMSKRKLLKIEYNHISSNEYYSKVRPISAEIDQLQDICKHEITKTTRHYIICLECDKTLGQLI